RAQQRPVGGKTPPGDGDLRQRRHEHRDVEPAHDLPDEREEGDRGSVHQPPTSRPSRKGERFGRSAHWSFLRIFQRLSTRRVNSTVARTSVASRGRGSGTSRTWWTRPGRGLSTTTRSER